ncbi:branched-chain amino acid ABC transporter permease [Natronomonas amylolytica]|uniref:branched-chain amino acid ABC transporter permease n=1 Tax=Natronomonas amylolytica TaxID=3108498 RepID=UPI00300AC872
MSEAERADMSRWGRLFTRLFETPSGVFGLILAILTLPLFVSIGLATEILILGVFALSYNLMFGFTGLLSFGHALFFGFGAYLAAGIIIETGLPLLPTLVVVFLLALGLSLVIGLISIQLSGIAFAMVTLAFAQLGYEAVLKLDEYTGGADGLLGIYRPSPLGLGLVDLTDEVMFYAVCAGIAVLCVSYTYLLSRSLFGRTLTAIRINEERTAALGVNTYRVKVIVFTIAGGMAAVMGGLWGMYIRFLSPQILYWSNTGDVILYTLIGGMQSVMGPILGAGFLRSVNRLLFETEPGYYNVTVGTIFVLIVLFERGGFIEMLNRAVQSLKNTVGKRSKSDENSDSPR